MAAVREAIGSLMEEVGALQGKVRNLRGQLSNPASSTSFLLDRDGFVREVMRQIAMIERYGTPASLIYFCAESNAKAEGPKEDASNRLVLAHIAEFLRRHVRESDAVGRLAENQFALLLTHVTEEQAGRKAEGLAALLCEHIPRPLGFTLSYAVAPLRAGSFADGANPVETDSGISQRCV